MIYTVSGSIYVRCNILKARKLYNYYASTSHMNLHNLTTYHPESKEKMAICKVVYMKKYISGGIGLGKELCFTSIGKLCNRVYICIYIY